MNGRRDFLTQLSAETLTELLTLARQAGAEEEARRIWDALCEVNGHRCELCRICSGWKKGQYAGYRTK